ncbi:MAG: VWA domain-containing protein [Gammaproteobacteria bacterium]|nr:MAG: VWA domain-containing protein [Gammaproteobacteria bacterium]RLA58217.1 MAG: VWA domain-containing protein [Gammaproteobacteria bacterium]
MAKLPSRRSSSAEIDRFLHKSKAITQFVEKQPRLMFAVDATASRQPTWDNASYLQQEMFRATNKVTELAVQLCYYRGFHEFYTSRWLTDSKQLAQLMGQVQCEGGHTQIARLLRHAQGEQRKTSVKALVFIGDAVEESADTLCQLAGQCGMLQLPLFLFQEGHGSGVEKTFRAMAKLSSGAYAHFDSHSASTLEALLGAVARYVAGGRTALEDSGSDSAKLLLQQLKP